MRGTWKVVLVASLGIALVACKKEEAPAPGTAPQGEAAEARKPGEVPKARLQIFAPLPEVMASEANPVTDEKVALGRMLYFETRLSKAQEFSCNSCHVLDAYGVDGEPTSPGHKGQRGDRNSPTVYNAAGHFAQFWDGRAKDVEEQALGPITNPVEMAMPDGDHAIKVLKSIPGYVEAFAKAFPGEADPMTYDNVGKAIGAFERKLVTPSRWDKFLAGDETALTEAEREGFNTFYETGCISCHKGAYLGGDSYQKLGMVVPYPDVKDEGRAKVTGQDSDKYLFKVPSLRNVAKTGPYFHDGSIKTLDEVITLMAKHQLGRDLEAAQVASIATFLNALTGDLPTDYIKKPELPASGPETPAPDPT